MARVALSLLSASLCAMAQFSSLAVTDDGGQVYFLSERPLKSERSRTLPASGLYRIERHADGMYGSPVVFRAPSTTPRRESYRRLAVGISGDGTAVLWNDATHPGPGCGSLCNSTPWTYTTMLASAGSDTVETYRGLGRISRNGRYLLSSDYEKLLVDRPQQTFVRVSLLPEGTPVDQVFGVTSNGQVLVRTGENLAIWTTSGNKVLTRGVSYANAVISDDGRTVVYVDRQNLLTAVDTASGRVLLTSAGSSDPSLSNNGERLLFTREANSEKQVFLADLTGASNTRQLTSVSGGVQAAVLAGFGMKAFRDRARW